MKNRFHLAIALAALVAAAPAITAVCDLSCASAPPARPAAAAPKAENACPLHAAETAPSAPRDPATAPCHGARSDSRSAVLLAPVGSAAAANPARALVFEAAAGSSGTNLVRVSTRMSSGSSLRSPGSAPPLPILRV